MIILNAKRYTLNANNKGVVLLLTFIIMATLIVIVAVFLYMTSVEIRNAGYELTDSQALWIAEGGIQQAIYKVKSDAVYRANPTTLSGNLGAGSYSVTVTKNGSLYNVTSKGIVGTAKRKITCVVQQTGSPFTYAGFGNSSITMSGAAIIDSYNSSIGRYGVNGNQGQGGNVGGNADLSMSGSAYINGNVSLGASSHFTDPTHQYESGAVTNTNSTPLTAVTVPATLTGLASSGAINPNNQNVNIGSGNYKYSTINLNGIDTLTINANTGPVNIYLTGNSASIAITNSGQIIIPATNTYPVTLYIDGSASVSGAGILNNSYLPTNVQIYATGSSPVTISNGGSFYGAVYAPSAGVTVSGGAVAYGSVIANSLTLANSGTIHYDQALATATTSFGSSAYAAKSWHEVVPAG